MHRHAAEADLASRNDLHEAALERGRRSNPAVVRAAESDGSTLCLGRCSSPAVDLCHSGHRNNPIASRNHPAVAVRGPKTLGADRDRRNIPTAAVLAAVPTSLARAEDLCHPTHRLVDPIHRLAAAAALYRREAVPIDRLSAAAVLASLPCTDPRPADRLRAHHRRVRRVHRVHRVLRARLDPHRPRDARPRADLSSRSRVGRRCPSPPARSPSVPPPTAPTRPHRASGSSHGSASPSSTVPPPRTWRSSTSRVGSRSEVRPGTDPPSRDDSSSVARSAPRAVGVRRTREWCVRDGRRARSVDARLELSRAEADSFRDRHL